MQNKRRVAVVTGGSRGIGLAVSCKLIESGCFVIAICSGRHNEEKTKDIYYKKIGRSKNYIILCTNIKYEQEVINTAKYISDNYGQVDYLINCAGIMEPESVNSEKEKMENWDEIMNVNLRGTFLVCKYMIPLIPKSRDAHIINISGGLGLFSNGMTGGTLPAYRISKSAINALTLILSEELLTSEIMVNSIDPGWVKTDMGGSDAPKMPEEVAEEIYQLLIKSFDQKETGKLFRENVIIDY